VLLDCHWVRAVDWYVDGVWDVLLDWVRNVLLDWYVYGVWAVNGHLDWVWDVLLDWVRDVLLDDHLVGLWYVDGVWPVDGHLHWVWHFLVDCVRLGYGHFDGVWHWFLNVHWVWARYVHRVRAVDGDGDLYGVWHVLLDWHGVRVPDFFDDGLGQQLCVTVVTDVLSGVTVHGVTSSITGAADAVRFETVVRFVTTITKRREMPLSLAGVSYCGCLGFYLGLFLLRLFTGKSVSAQTDRTHRV